MDTTPNEVLPEPSRDETTPDDAETTYTVISVNGEKKTYVLGTPETAPVADAVRKLLD